MFNSDKIFVFLFLLPSCHYADYNDTKDNVYLKPMDDNPSNKTLNNVTDLCSNGKTDSCNKMTTEQIKSVCGEKYEWPEGMGSGLSITKVTKSKCINTICTTEVGVNSQHYLLKVNCTQNQNKNDAKCFCQHFQLYERCQYRTIPTEPDVPTTLVSTKNPTTFKTTTKNPNATGRTKRTTTGTTTTSEPTTEFMYYEPIEPVGGPVSRQMKMSGLCTNNISDSCSKITFENIKEVCGEVYVFQYCFVYYTKVTQSKCMNNTCHIDVETDNPIYTIGVSCKQNSTTNYKEANCVCQAYDVIKHTTPIAGVTKK